MSPDTWPGARSALTLPATPPCLAGRNPFRDRSRLWGESWRIGIIPRSLPRLLEDPDGLADTRWLDSPWPHGYVCDPWIVSDRGGHVVFFEFMDGRSRQGAIAAGRLVRTDDRWRLENVRPVIQEPHHLSHPCVFESGGRWYLMPEAADCGHVVLYEAVSFPYRWRLCGALLPGVPGLDPTYFETGNRVWIACCLAAGNDVEELHLYHSDRLDGTWRPHPGNPVSRGRRGSRPGGPFVRAGGRILRLGQDNRGTYGAGVLVKEVEVCDETAYRERELALLAPSPHWTWARGLHTLAPGPGFCLVDAKRFTGLKSLFGDLLLKWRHRRDAGRD